MMRRTQATSVALTLFCVGLSLSCTKRTANPSLDSKVELGNQEWINTKNIHPQTSSHSRLREEQVTRTKRIQAALSAVDPSSLEKWIGDFEKDQDPEKELRIWEAIAAAYQSYCSSRSVDMNTRREVFRVLLMRSETSDEAQVISHVHLSTLTSEQAHDVMGYFKGDARPIEVETR